MVMGVFVGLDLGTTNSVVCLFDGQKFTFIKDPSGSCLIPSVVCYADEKMIGRDAAENEENFPDRTIRSSKRYIGQNTILIDDNVTAREVATDILVYLKSLTENQTKTNIDGIVITVPAYFNQNQRLETKLAAEKSGLAVLRIINEPTSAAIAYNQDAKTNALSLIYDLGGGTFDVTLLNLSDDNVYEVLSTSGNTQLGGDDFDQVIVDEFNSTLPPNFKKFRDYDVKLKSFAEDIKIQLGYKDQIKRTLKYCGTIDSKIYHHEFSITADRYKKLIYELLLKTKSHVLNALNDANRKISHLDRIILVGGSTKSKFVREFVEQEFNTKVYYEIDPDLTVACGAASLAHSIATQSESGVVLIDVTPLSLGIETKGGLLNKVIPRNTGVPVTAEQYYITAEDNQDSVIIRIYQGERPLAKDNEFLGEFELSGFEKRPKGQTKIVVRFDINADGLVTVTAFDQISGLNTKVILKSLTTQEANHLMHDMSDVYKKDDLAAVEQIELQELRQIARTLITLSEDKELSIIYDSVKDNIVSLKVFIQSIKDESLCNLQNT